MLPEPDELLPEEERLLLLVDGVYVLVLLLSDVRLLTPVLVEDLLVPGLNICLMALPIALPLLLLL